MGNEAGAPFRATTGEYVGDRVGVWCTLSLAESLSTPYCLPIPHIGHCIRLVHSLPFFGRTLMGDRMADGRLERNIQVIPKVREGIS